MNNLGSVVRAAGTSVIRIDTEPETIGLEMGPFLSCPLDVKEPGG